MAAIRAISTSRLCLRFVNIVQRQLLAKSQCPVYALKLFSASANMKADLYYTTSHEWIRVDGSLGTVGISKYAEENIGDVIHVQQPDTGSYLRKGDNAVQIKVYGDSSDIYSPVSGYVSNINKKLEYNPKLLNSDPMKEDLEYEDLPDTQFKEA